MRKEMLKWLKENYKKGTRVKLLWMEGIQAPPEGTEGTIICVDDIGTIHVAWDNGSTLGLVNGKDGFRVL